MKTPITVRVDPKLLEAVRKCAQEENRSLTNFIETALKDRVAREEGSAERQNSSVLQTRGSKTA